jgi:hypothetical protein
MEYRKNNPANLTFKWIMLVFFIIVAVVSFIRYKKTLAEKVDKDEKKSA